MTDMTRVRALRAFTFTTGFGQFHGDPDNSVAAVRFPRVPSDLVERLVEDMKVDLEVDEIAEVTAPDPDQDDDGGETPLVNTEHLGGGYFAVEVDGKQVAKVRGKDAAEAKAEEIRGGMGTEAESDAPAE